MFWRLQPCIVCPLGLFLAQIGYFETITSFPAGRTWVEMVSRQNTWTKRCQDRRWAKNSPLIVHRLKILSRQHLSLSQGSSKDWQGASWAKKPPRKRLFQDSQHGQKGSTGNFWQKRPTDRLELKNLARLTGGLKVAHFCVWLFWFGFAIFEKQCLHKNWCACLVVSCLGHIISC